MSSFTTNTNHLEGKLFSEKDNELDHTLEKIEAKLSYYEKHGLEIEQNKYLEEQQLDKVDNVSDNAIIQNRFDEHLKHLKAHKDYIVSHIPDQKQNMTFVDREHARINLNENKGIG